jgi:branched-chain amino acid transport system substrate-binding protein
MRNYLYIIPVLLIVMLTLGCTQQAPTQEVKIGVVASMTGPTSSTGKDIWQSAMTAADEINAQGGVFVKSFNAKVPIRLIQGDDESTREGGQKAVTKLMTEDKVDLLVGGFSSAVVSAHQSIVAEYKVPYIITGASTPTITRRPDINTSYMFHHCPTTDDYGEQTILFVDQVVRPAINQRFSYPSDRPLRLALIYQDSPYGKGVQSAVNQTITNMNLNMEVVGEQTFKMGESDFRTALTAIKAASPDVVYPVTFLNEQIALLTQARRDVGLNSIFLSVECNDDPDYYRGLGRLGEYSIQESRFSPYTAPKGPLMNATQNFKNNFKAKWGGFPGMMGASTYEGIYIASAAIEKAGTTDHDAVKAALSDIKIPQIIEVMGNSTIQFSPDFRESDFALYMEQLIWDPAANELRPKIVWPDSVKETEFILPDWFTPGSKG